MDEATMTTGTVTTGIAHIGLTVPDINLSRDFFVNCLGWKQVGEKPEYPVDNLDAMGSEGQGEPGEL
jgi:catechol 2,3-dioxygenase-like lactoylglutathione lyase family enzyme